MNIFKNGIMYVVLFLTTIFVIDIPLEMGNLGIMRYSSIDSGEHQIVVFLVMAIGGAICMLRYLNSGDNL